MPDRRKQKGTVLDRSVGEPRTVHRADDIRTKWQFFAFLLQTFVKHWFKITFLIALVGMISFFILRYTNVIDIFGRG